MIIALILSGGTGRRLGSSVPKQYIEAGNKPVITYSLETLLKHEEIDGVHIVADREWWERIGEWVSALDNRDKFKGFSLPGATRQLSIYNGIRDIAEYSDEKGAVLIHDGARPCLGKRQISECIRALKGHDGVLPVLPMKDTVYESADGGKTVASLLDRSRIFAGQAPELFYLKKYLEANERLLPDEILKINGSTEPAILAGLDIAMIPGDEKNFKITTYADLERFEKYISDTGK